MPTGQEVQLSLLTIHCSILTLVVTIQLHFSVKISFKDLWLVKLIVLAVYLYFIYNIAFGIQGHGVSFIHQI